MFNVILFTFITKLRFLHKLQLENLHITLELYFMLDALWVVTHLLTRNARD